MKILHINTERTWRGGEQQLMYLLLGLKRYKLDPHLICQLDSPMCTLAAEQGVVCHPLKMNGECDLRAAWQIRGIIRKNKYDLVHSHTSHAHTLAFLSSLGIDVRLLVTRRVDFSIFRHGFGVISALKYKYMANHYIAISHEIKRVLVNDGIDASRISVAHSGIELNRLSTGDPAGLRKEFGLEEDEAVVINVAHLAGHKGQKYLIRAIPDVLARIPKVRFIIVGQGELRQELESLASSLSLGDRLIFTGFRSDISSFYHLADLFVMSSIQEGLGTAVLDALALGVPVVSTDAGGLPEIIENGKTGSLVPAFDSKALAQGMLELLLQPDKAGQMARQGREKVRELFSVEAMVESNYRIYKELLAQ